MHVLKIWILVNMAVLALLANGAAVAQDQPKPSALERALQMRLGNEVQIGLNASSAAFAMKDRIDELEKQLADKTAELDKLKEKNASDKPEQKGVPPVLK